MMVSKILSQQSTDALHRQFGLDSSSVCFIDVYRLKYG
ncbi:hypothetical protein JCM19239_156 [Vibrio variabilis]|uniref:Uncharacterized protein n=1 Tax=Vibrio variabilis TaxID=990271 RepID=A0ABQ0JD08_9VIBR|nr:hypothetical protein JCM19239_156 [Vibrio variabilis]